MKLTLWGEGMKNWQVLLGLILLVGVSFSACVSLVHKDTPGEKALDNCTRDYIAKKELTPDTLEICKGIKKAVDMGVLKP